MLNYAIVGGGRLARHFSQYFQLLEIPHSHWSRDRWSPFNTFENPDAGLRLRKTVSNADRVLLLVSENNINSLDGDFLQDLYHAFIRFYQNSEGRNPVLEQTRMERTI